VIRCVRRFQKAAARPKSVNTGHPSASRLANIAMPRSSLTRGALIRSRIPERSHRLTQNSEHRQLPLFPLWGRGHLLKQLRPIEPQFGNAIKGRWLSIWTGKSLSQLDASDILNRGRDRHMFLQAMLLELGRIFRCATNSCEAGCRCEPEH
jgi:hypothetical protein